MRLLRVLGILVMLSVCVLVPRGAHAADDSDAEPADPVARPAEPPVSEPPAAPDSPDYARAFSGVPSEVDEADLAARPADQELAPSLSAEQLRAMVKVARAKVLATMQAKMEAKSEARMQQISALIGWFSLAGLLLLAMPLVLRKRFPGRGAMLFKYSALAAITFVVTVNLFGAVVLGFRTAQAKVGDATNPQLRVASAFFDTLDDHAEDYLVMGKELFAPTLEHLQDNEDEQPAAVLLENGQKLVKDASVFVTVAKMFKRLDVVLSAIPTILLLVTMVLFVLALRPTLLEIVRLPITAAEGGQPGVGRSVVRSALRRVGGELLATICTIGVLIVLTLLAGAILGRVVAPALDSLIGYFSLGITYLQFVKDASSGLVFVMMLGVILFLVLNLGVVIASMSIFLGKTQKIFQRRFNDGVALGAHRAFWLRGIPALLVAQLLPCLFIAIADWGLDKLDEKLVGGATDPAQIPWAAIMLAGPLALVGGFLLVFWAGRGLASLKFLATYKPQSVS